MLARISVMPQPGSLSDAEAMLVLSRNRTLVMIAVVWLLAGVSLRAAPIFPNGKAFVEKYCAECHDDVTREAIYETEACGIMRARQSEQSPGVRGRTLGSIRAELSNGALVNRSKNKRRAATPERSVDN